MKEIFASALAKEQEGKKRASSQSGTSSGTITLGDDSDCESAVVPTKAPRAMEGRDIRVWPATLKEKKSLHGQT